MSRTRLGVLVSHPIQYYVPLYRKISESNKLDICVYFMTNFGVTEDFDEEFSRHIKFDIPLLSGYRFKILENLSLRKNHKKFFGMINFGIVTIVKNRIDVLIIHGWNSFTSIIAMLACIIFRKKYYLRSDSNSVDLNRSANWKIRILRFLKGLLIVPLLKKATGVMAIGIRNKEYFLALGVPADKIYWVPFSIDDQRFSKDLEKKKISQKKFKSKYSLRQDDLIYLYSGKFIDKKGLLNFVKAFKEFNKGVLFLVGDGPMKVELELLTQDTSIVHFAGFVNQLEITQYYLASDFIVLPSKIEPWGLCINEGIAAGCIPIVSNVCGCAPELVETTSNLIFNSNDSISILEVLNNSLELIYNDSIAKKLKHISSLISLDATVKAIEDILL